MSDFIWVKVTGTVGRVFTTKNGSAMTVEVSRPNAQYPDRLTVWDAFDFQTGDRVVVEGWLSWRKSERDGKTYVDVSVNAPRLPGGPQEPRGRDNTTGADSWATPGSYDDSKPF